MTRINITEAHFYTIEQKIHKNILNQKMSQLRSSNQDFNIYTWSLMVE